MYPPPTPHPLSSSSSSKELKTRLGDFAAPCHTHTHTHTQTHTHRHTHTQTHTHRHTHTHTHPHRHTHTEECNVLELEKGLHLHTQQLDKNVTHPFSLQFCQLQRYSQFMQRISAEHAANEGSIIFQCSVYLLNTKSK